jgi:hypothetical protein
MKSITNAISKEVRPLRYALFAVAAFLMFVLAGCGGSSSSNSSTTTTTGLKKRVLLSNAQTGLVVIMDASKDVLSSGSVSAPGASKMVTAGGFTTVIDSTLNAYSVIDNTKEQGVQQPQTLDRVVDIAISSDGKSAYAAVRNVSVVDVVNTTSGAFSVINVPSPARLAISPNGTKVLVFPDDPQALVGFPANSFFVIDASSMNVTTISGGGLDQPFTAVFNGSETQAFVLNCGAECGGTTASVIKVDFSSATPTFSAPIPVSAATVGLVNSGTLFVAGTPAGSATGTLQSINLSSLTASAPVSITNGTHLKMAMASNNRLYIGASNCTASTDPATGQVRGCLSIFNTGSSSVTVPEVASLRTFFNVTGIQPISNRNVVYVCEGGELDIYDTTTDKLTPTQIDIVGNAVDVVQIDP